MTTDVLVIGGGPGGYTAAFRAADLGAKVTLVSDDELGGVCLLRGCIPSKMLLHVTEVMESVRGLKELGLDYGAPDQDLQRLRSRKDSAVSGLVSGLMQLAKERDIQVVRGRARLTGSREALVEADDQSAVRFDHAVVAPGSRPASLPDAEFDERIMDAGAALRLDEVPDRLLVVGGGYVGLELGTVYAELGSEVTIAEADDRLMPGTDVDLVRPLQKRIEKIVNDIHLNTPVERLERTANGVNVDYGGDDTPASATFDKVLVAIGRLPNTTQLGLEHTRAELDDADFVVVDGRRKTADDRIYAVGDVTGGTCLAHEAMREGKVAAEAMAGEPSAFDPAAIPAVVYTNPQVAWCGLTEDEASRSGREVEVSRFPWSASGRAKTTGSSDGLTKIVSDPESRRVLGVGIVGRQAEALIAEGVLAIEMGAVLEDLALTIHAHPTFSETIAESAEMADGRAIHARTDSGS